jgi:hypothetical protein
MGNIVMSNNHRPRDLNRDFPQRRMRPRDALVMLMWLCVLVGLITLVAVVGG